MESKIKKRLNTLTSIALLLSTIPLAQCEILGTQSNEAVVQKQWLHVDESQGQGLWQLQSIDKIRPELSRMPSRKQRSEYNKQPINFDAIQIDEDQEYDQYGAPNSQLLQINQQEKFLGEPVRWIKCAFIDCDAVDANKKKVQDKIDVEKKVKQDKLDEQQRKERDEREVRERSFKKQQPVKKEIKPVEPKVEKKVEPKKEETKKEEKKEEPKVETPPKKKEEKVEEKPKVEDKPKQDILKNESKIDDEVKKDSGTGSLFDTISKPKDDALSKYSSSAGGGDLGGLGGLLTNTQLKEDMRGGEQNEQFETEDPSYLRNNQEMTQLGNVQKSNIQLSIDSNIKRHSNKTGQHKHN